jgi:hypothetical protein
MSKLDIGLRQSKVLCQMRHGERLDFIAEGLPIVLESARGFWAASQLLTDKPREADVLEGHAEEEAAKILILLDVIRCPRKLSAAKIGQMVTKFYDHLGPIDLCERRLMETDACHTITRVRQRHAQSPLS